ncbi:MAG: T9SS type A sorting domain-containing protein [Fimbriimonadaceae bacterium]|nr:T9SS type A sorting domain-containing protein [Chitinophagales bacterium]
MKITVLLISIAILHIYFSNAYAQIFYGGKGDGSANVLSEIAIDQPDLCNPPLNVSFNDSLLTNLKAIITWDKGDSTGDYTVIFTDTLSGNSEIIQATDAYVIADVLSGITYSVFVSCICFTGDTLYSDTIIFTVPVFRIAGNDNQQKSAIEVYPNPATQYVKIDHITEFQNGSVKIFSGYGQILSTEIIEGNEMRLNIQHYLPGVYYLILEKDEKKYICKIIKQ